MIKQYFKKRKLNTFFKRQTAVIMSVALLIGTLSIGAVLAQDGSDTVNFPLLRNYKEGEVPNASDNWKFGITDYGIKPDFKNSSDDFAAPAAEFDPDGNVTVVSWEKYTNAVKYMLNIYKGSSLYYSETTDKNEWRSTAATALQPGAVYEMQVIALANDGGTVAASAIRKFSVKADAVIPDVIRDFNGESEEELKGVSFSRIASKRIDDGQRLVIETKNTETYSHLYIKGSFTSKTASALMFYVKAEDSSIFNIQVGFGEKTNSCQSKASGNKATYYIVPKDNPNRFISGTISNTKIPRNESAGDFKDGYYVVIPLDLYADDIKTAIADGNYQYIDILFESPQYKDEESGKYVNAGSKAYFNGSDIAIDDISFLSDAEKWVSESIEKYNSSYKFNTADSNKIYYANKLASGLYINEDIKGGYSLKNSSEERAVTFNAKANAAERYGSYLEFTASEAGLYDFAGSLYIKDNRDNVGTVKYRVLKRSADASYSVLYPSGENQSGEWAELEITEAELNPTGKFPAVQAELSAGESVVIEAYAEPDTSGECEFNICLGNPTATLVKVISTYKGEAAVYDFGDYTPHSIYDDKIDAGKFKQTNGRFEAVLMLNRDGNISYSDFTGALRYNMHYTPQLKNKDGSVSDYIGYYYYIPKKDCRIMLQSGLDGYGTSFRFTSPASGSACVSLSFLANNPQGTKYRIIKNGAKLYPEASDWADVPVKASDIQAACSVNEGDVIAVEFYGETSGKINCKLKESPTVTVYGSEINNKASDTTFSALWERPYNNKDYSGAAVLDPTSPYSFNILKVSDKSALSADSYDSSDKMLYNAKAGKTGYIFEKSRLEFLFDDESYGMDLDFTAPESGYYDFSTAINKLAGSGKLYVRLLNNGTLLYPEKDWREFQPDADIFEPLEIGLEAGDCVKLQIYAASAAEGEKTRISLGVPAVQRLNNRVFTETGNTTVYTPYTYTVFEQGYNGEYSYTPSRFDYTLIGSDGENIPLKQTVTAESRLYDESRENYIGIDQSNFSFKLNAGNRLLIRFKSVMDGNAVLSLNSGSISGDISTVIKKNGAVISETSGGIPETVTAELKKSDILVIELYSQNGAAVTLDGISIAQTGRHNNANTSIDNGFYAAYADPYGDGYYNGSYKRTDDDFWAFDFYDAGKDKTVEANYYSSKNNNCISNTSLDFAGYNFGSYFLSAKINAEKKYGLSLGFVSPRDDTFALRCGLRITDADVTAELKYRIVKVPADSTQAQTLYPAEGEWESVSAESNKDIVIPYKNFELNKGDKIYLQIYAASSDSDVINITLVSPAMLKEAISRVETSDIVADIYEAINYGPYNYVKGYNGAYYHMADRWSFMFINASDSKLDTFKADKIRTDTNNQHIYYSAAGNAPRFLWNLGSGQLANRSAVSTDENIGTQMNFICPADGSYLLNAAASIGKLDIASAKAKYRVIKKNAVSESEERIWPLGDSEWEMLTSNSLSDCMNVEFEANAGDTVQLQLYWEADGAEISEYLNKTGKRYWTPEYYISPQIVRTEFTDDTKSAFSAASGFIGNYQISPYWKVLSATDSNAPQWRLASKYQWGYWLDSLNNYMGMSYQCRWWIKNHNSALSGYESPAVALSFTPKNSGWVIMGNSTAELQNLSTAGKTAEIRITLNGKNVYPANGWEKLESGKKVSFKGLTFEVSAGDCLQFEMRSTSSLEDGEQVYIGWIPAFNISKYRNIYNQSNDIYNMLDSKMLSFFKSFDPLGEFDENINESKLLSEKIAALKKARQNAGGGNSESNGTIGGNKNNANGGDYSEWTESIVTPGGRWKKIKRYYYTEWWVYALIAGGAVIGTAGVVLTVILLVKKKKRLTDKEEH